MALGNHLLLGIETDSEAKLVALDHLDDGELGLTGFNHADEVAGVECLRCQGSALGIHEGQQSHDASTLHSIGEVALLLSSEAGETAGKNLAPFSDELLEQVHIFVIDGITRLDRRKTLLEE